MDTPNNQHVNREHVAVAVFILLTLLSALALPGLDLVGEHTDLRYAIWLLVPVVGGAISGYIYRGTLVATALGAVLGYAVYWCLITVRTAFGSQVLWILAPAAMLGLKLFESLSKRGAPSSSERSAKSKLSLVTVSIAIPAALVAIYIIIFGGEPKKSPGKLAAETENAKERAAIEERLKQAQKKHDELQRQSELQQKQQDTSHTQPGQGPAKPPIEN